MASSARLGYGRWQPLRDLASSACVLLVAALLLEREGSVNDASARLLARVWTPVWTELAGRDAWMAFVVWTNAWGALVYWAFGAVFLLLDLGEFAFAQRYKIQPGTNTPLSRAKLARLVAQVVFNQVVVGVAFSAAMMPVIVWRGVNFTNEDIPGVATFLRHLVGYAIVEEVLFYYSHRAFHEIKFLYKAVHKQHHEWVASIAVAARYAHPLEDVLSNVLPVFSGPLLMNSPLVFWWIWLLIALVATVQSHSGYHFPFMPSPEAHDFHHLAFDVNYGPFGVLDELHGTSEKFHRNKAILRHHVLLSLRSAREEVPPEAPSAPPKKQN